MSCVLPQQFRLGDHRGWILCPFKKALGSAAPSFLYVHNRQILCVCHFFFGQLTASFFLAHPYMENPPCEEGFRRSFSSSVEWTGAFALCGASERDRGGRREDKQEDASTLSISAIRGENGGAAEPWMLGGGDDISINIIVSLVTMRCSTQMMKHEVLWIKYL